MTGFGVTLGFIWVGGLAAIALIFLLRRENKARDAGKRDYLYSLPEEELRNLGDDHPDFRFIF